MIPLEERVQRIETQLDRLTPSLFERLTRLENAVSPRTDTSAQAQPTPPKRSLAFGKAFMAWMGTELPKLLTALVVLFVAWGLKDSVDLAIKRRQLDLSYAKEMQGLLIEMGKKDAEKAQLESTAVVLASYGEAALPALLNELRHGDLRSDAAVAGLTALASVNLQPVCDALPSALTNRGRQYDWRDQLKVVRLLGENGCKNGVPSLRGYRVMVAAASTGNTTALADSVRALPLSPAEEYPNLLAAIDRSLEMLRE